MHDSASRSLRIFLCHSSNDKPTVRELYQKLSAEGWMDVWLDEEKLLPGQDWDFEIDRALDTSDAVIVTLSTASVSTEGYVQKELRFALDIALEKPEGTIFILPVRLDDCEQPRKLRSIQGIDYFPSDRRELAYARLRRSLESRARTLGIVTNTAESKPAAPQAPIMPLWRVILNHASIILIFSIVLLFFSNLPLTDCMHPYLGKLSWSLIIVLAFLLIGGLLGELTLFGWKISLATVREYLGSQYLFDKNKPWLGATVVAIYALSILLVRYLGSSPASPWQIQEHPIVLKQFSVILSPGSKAEPALPDTDIKIPRGYLTYFLAEVDPSTTGCHWSSLKSGNLQTANQCSTYYSPPLESDFDLLDIKMTSACNTKQNVNHLKVLVLP
jgi:hypothetical protein